MFYCKTSIERVSHKARFNINWLCCSVESFLVAERHVNDNKTVYSLTLILLLGSLSITEQQQYQIRFNSLGGLSDFNHDVSYISASNST